MMKSSGILFLQKRIRQCVVLLAVITFFISCGKKEEKKIEAAVAFEMTTFLVESGGGCKSDTFSCAYYAIKYPVFKSLAASVQDSLHVKISEAVDTGNPEADTISFQQAGKTFIADFEKVRKTFPEDAMGWHYKATIKPTLVIDTLISLVAKNEYFSGGAHGGYGTFFVNISPSTGRTMTLNDVLKPGFEGDLTKAAEVSFRHVLNINDTTSYSMLGFEFEDDKFKLNDNYGFSDAGITFVFNVYEIGPYALGSTEILIPYENIKNWLK